MQNKDCTPLLFCAAVQYCSTILQYCIAVPDYCTILYCTTVLQYSTVLYCTTVLQYSRILYCTTVLQYSTIQQSKVPYTTVQPQSRSRSHIYNLSNSLFDQMSPLVSVTELWGWGGGGPPPPEAQCPLRRLGLTQRHTDIATYRLNWPRGQFSENTQKSCNLYSSLKPQTITKLQCLFLLSGNSLPPGEHGLWC